MADRFDLIVKGGILVNEHSTGEADIGISDGRIAAVGDLAAASAENILDVNGLHVLPGVIDTQVHFREPGAEHKEDLETGSRAAVAGGVTAVFEMPNTSPPTTDVEALEWKISRATNRMYCDFAFYIGATYQNIPELPNLEKLPGTAGIKVFMGSSTGNLLVEKEEAIAQILAAITRRAAFHSEDEERLNERKPLRREGDPSSHYEWRDTEAAVISTKRLVAAAHRTKAQVHVLHTSTAEEISFLADHKDVASVEVTPQHLTLVAPEAYERLGTRAQMNPPIREARHREALWEGLRSGVVDIIGSDHAPHTLEEKGQIYPDTPSGMTGVQTLVPIMLDHVNAGRLSLERFVELSSHAAERLFGIADKGHIAQGYDADLTIVDMNAERVIEDSWIESRSGWTPFAGTRVKGWPIGTMIRGRNVMWEGEIFEPAGGQPVRFEDRSIKAA